MKVKLGDIVNQIQLSDGQLISTQSALEALRTQRIPSRVGFMLRDSIIPTVYGKIENYHKERIAKCEQYGKLDTENNQFKFETPEKRKEFDAELKLLLDTEIDLPFEPLKKSDIAIANMTELELEVLAWLFESDKKPDAPTP